MVINIWANSQPEGKLPGSSPDGRDWSSHNQPEDLSFARMFESTGSSPSVFAFTFFFLEDLISQFCGEDLQISQQGDEVRFSSFRQLTRSGSLQICTQCLRINVWFSFFSYRSSPRSVSSSPNICSSDSLLSQSVILHPIKETVFQTGTYGRTVAGWLWKLPTDARSRISHGIMGL